MRAKFIYESLDDYLTPKSNEDIINGLSKLSQEELDNALSDEIIRNNNNNVKLLIKCGANVNSKDEQWITPLMWAVIFGFEDTALILIDNGANLNDEDYRGNTPILWAIRKKRYYLINLLKSHGAKE